MKRNHEDEPANEAQEPSREPEPKRPRADEGLSLRRLLILLLFLLVSYLLWRYPARPGTSLEPLHPPPASPLGPAPATTPGR